MVLDRYNAYPLRRFGEFGSLYMFRSRHGLHELNLDGRAWGRRAAQCSDNKEADFSRYTYVTDGYYFGMSPQGDAARIYNYVRLMRDI